MKVRIVFYFFVDIEKYHSNVVGCFHLFSNKHMNILFSNHSFSYLSTNEYSFNKTFHKSSFISQPDTFLWKLTKEKHQNEKG